MTLKPGSSTLLCLGRERKKGEGRGSLSPLNVITLVLGIYAG